MIGKHRVPDIGRIGGNISVGAFCRAEVGSVKRAVGVEQFGIAESDSVAKVHARHRRSHHADHVLPHVYNPFVSFPEDRHRSQQPLLLDVRVGLRRKEPHRIGSLVVIGQRAASLNRILAGHSVAGIVDILAVHILAVVVDDGIIPQVVVIVWLCPVAKVEAGVVGLAVEFIALAYGAAVGDLPTVAADDGVRRAVLVGHLQLHEQLWQAVVCGVKDAAPFQIVGVVARGGEASALEDDANSVLVASPHDVGYVVGIEIDTLGIVAKGRFQDLVHTHFGAVDVGGVDTQATDVESGFHDIAFECKLLAQVAGGDGGVAIQMVVLVVAPNPLRLPIVGREEAYLKVLHVAFEGLISALVAVGDGGIHAPPAAVAAFQRLALVGDVEHLVGIDKLGVPQVADALLRVFFRGGYDDAVVGLHDVGDLGLITPAEARVGGSQRDGAVLHLDGGVDEMYSAAARGEQECQKDGDYVFHGANRFIERL